MAASSSDHASVAAEPVRGSNADGQSQLFCLPTEASPQDVNFVRTLLSRCLACVHARFPDLQMNEEQLAQVLHASPLYQRAAVRAHCLGEKVANSPRPFSCLESSAAEKRSQQENKERLFRFWSDTGIVDDIHLTVCRMKHDYFARQNRWCAPEADETIAALRCKAEMKHIEALSTITADMDLPLCTRRSQAKQDKFIESWEGIKFSCDVFELNDEDMQPMVKGRDIFDLLHELREDASPPTASTFRSVRFLSGKLPSLSELRSIFYRLSPFYNHVSSHDLYSWHAYIDDDKCMSLDRRSAQAVRMLQMEDLERVRRHLQHGAVTDQRAQLWAFSLNEQQMCDDKTWSSRSRSRHYQALVDDVCRWELLLDHVMMRCVQTTVNNDLQYFIFEDIAYQVILLFMHDESVAARLQVITPLALTDDWTHPARHCPPCGVIPFTEFAFYIIPITYVRSKVEQVYYTFREMYLNYFQFLHTINSHPYGLIAQCALFESIMIAVAPDIIKHFSDIRTDPLRFAYRWLMTAFSGFLPVQELLQLWDRILGFDDMRLLAVTSVGIFLAKKQRLMQAQTCNAVKKILKNLSDVGVLDLLQEVLFNNEIDCKYESWRQREFA